MLRYQVIPVTPFEQNCTLLWCDVTHEAAVVDPGGDLDRILEAARLKGVQIKKILLTHGHIDHAGGAGQLARQLNLPIEGPHQGDDYWISGLPQQAQMFRFAPALPFEPTRWLNEGDVVEVGNERLEVLHCPGHTPGHVAFYSRILAMALVGDVLFAGSIGRTDFPGGNHQQLINSIRQKLFPLGDDVIFIPGHGPTSTMGEERASNPFVADKRFG